MATERSPFDAALEPEVQNGTDYQWAVPTQAVQQVKTPYVTAVAVQKPRSLKDVEKRLLEEAHLLGEAAYYGWGAGKDKIEGPSIELAEAAARCFGNCAVECKEVVETPTAFLYTAYFIDLETGMTLSRPFRQSRSWTVHGKLDAERKEDMRFQIGATKATRNVILNALPRWLIDRAMERAKEGVRSKIEAYIAKHSIDAAREYLLSALAKCTVTGDAVLAKMERTARAGLTLDDLVILQGCLKALQNGEETAADLFPLAQKDPAGQPAAPERSATTQSDKVKEALKAKAEQPPPAPAAEPDAPAPEPETPVQEPPSPAAPEPPAPPTGERLASPAEVGALLAAKDKQKMTLPELKGHLIEVYKVDRLEKLPARHVQDLYEWINERAAMREQ